MTHLDLFSGIGGFAYAADTVWGGANVQHIFCDNDPFCQQVLKKHWPESEIYDDIRALITDTENNRGRRLGLERQQDATPAKLGSRDRVDLITGGFPCQPFSHAGSRGGTDDDRYLWPEMLEVIRLTQPGWVIAENVSGILTWSEGLVFEQVCADLEAAGYEVQPFIIPAAAVGAPHRRDRVWFVAKLIDAVSDGRKRPDDTPQAKSRGRSETEYWPASHGQNWPEVAAKLCGVDDGLPAELDGLKLSKPQHRRQQIKAYGNSIVPQVAMEIMEAMRL